MGTSSTIPTGTCFANNCPALAPLAANRYTRLQTKQGDGRVLQKRLTSFLKALNDLDHVEVKASSSGGTVHVTYNRHHALSFKFVWSKDHFIGYFVDGNGAQSQAVVSIYTRLDAMNFSSAFSLLAEMRAKQKT